MDGKIKGLESEISDIADVLRNGLKNAWNAQHPGTKIPEYGIKSQMNSGYPHVEAEIGDETCEIEPGMARGSVWIYGPRKTEVEACLAKSGYRIMN